MKAIKTAASGPICATMVCTIIAEIAVGPTLMSFMVPKMQYTKQGIILEYRPYCDGKPAMIAYAMACGIFVRATLTPATMSDTNQKNV